ncbi:MAG: adenosine deaminase [Streptomyces sp.]|nr:adenosine deaminase [Streptomyces sp.]
MQPSQAPQTPHTTQATGATQATEATGATQTTRTNNTPTREQILRAPKVLLHDHLDGGLRPATVVELAQQTGYPNLPETDPEKLGVWFREAADSGSLERYLETFSHTVGVMQTRDALVRVAAECAEDLAADGVVYAEVRYAPEQHLAAGLTLEEVVEAVNEGFREGERRAHDNGHRIRVGALLTAMRHAARALEIAELANRYRDLGVVGFDIAGAEAGYPPTRHLDAFEYLKRENNHFTIHAGEAFGLPSIWQALQWCGADRLGHGVRIIDDIEVRADGTVALGRLASYVRDKRIPLELCPSSNLQTGAASSYAEHPIGLLRRLHFRATVNTDNRLMSNTSMSQEFEHLVEAFGYTLDDMQWFSVNAMKSAFIPFDERLAMINDVIKPGYASLKSEWLFR